MANAVNTTQTMLSLDRFAARLGLHPLHFNQVYLPFIDETPCGLLPQYSWQADDSISREEIAQAIYDAESDIVTMLGYKLMPVWESEEVMVPRSYRPELWGTNRDIRGFNTGIKVKHGYLIQGGSKAKTLLSTPSVTYSSSGLVSSGTYNDKAVVTQDLTSTGVLDSSEVRVFFTGFNQDDHYEIRPINVSIASNIATITMRREQLVKRDLLESLDEPVAGIDGTEDTNFVTSLDVVRVYNDPSKQADIIWRRSCRTCSDNGCQACVYTEQPACVSITNPKLGVLGLQPSTYDPVNNIYTRDELDQCIGGDRALVYYQAGKREFTADWEDAIAHLAIARLDRELTSCKNIQEVVRFWSEDLAYSVSTSGRSVSAKLSPFQMNCPWGTSRGALMAYRKCWEAKLGV